MRALTNAEILDVWESGWQAASPQRAVLLLAAACPDKEPGELSAYSIGRRDAQLLELRGAMFGRRIVSLTKCPQCDENVQLEFSVDDFAEPVRVIESDDAAVILAEDYLVRFRLPDSLDQMAIVESPDAATAQRKLLSRCVTSVQRAGDQVSTESLPELVVAKMTERMAELDPLASIFLAVTCAACGNQWRTLFDVCDFLWRELNWCAQRLLQEVHVLASAYGWNESEILSLGATRRRLYLEMVNR